MKMIGLASALLLALSCSVLAQQNSTTSLSRNRDIPPPEWNVFADTMNAREPSVRDILVRSTKVYQSLATYQDHALTIKTNVGQNAYTRNESIARFDRASDKFRFESRDLDSSGARKYAHVIWKDKDQLKSWTELGGKLETPPSIEEAIWDVSYKSNRAAIEVLLVLLSDKPEKYEFWSRDSNKYRISDVTENDISYFRIQAMSAVSYGKPNESYTKTTYWIRKDDALLTRIVRDVSDKDLKFKSYSRTDYEPIINQPIPDSEFEFGH